MSDSPSAGTLGSIFVGRRAEVAILHDLLSQAQRGRVRVAFLEGEAGIGKTRIASELVTEAESRGVRVFAGRCDEMEQDRPFGALTEALGLRRTVRDPARARVSDLIGSAAPGDGPYAVTDAMAELVEEESRLATITLVVDDIHWADAGTLLAIRALSTLTGIPLLVVATLRPSPRSPVLGQLVKAVTRDAGMLVPVGPLSEAEADALARALLGRDPEPALTRVLAGAAGNPFFVTEVVAASSREADGDGMPEERLPPSLRATLLRTLGGLPEDSGALLRIAAVLGGTFSVTDLTLVLGRPVADLIAPLARVIEAGFLVEHGEDLRFRHDLIREAIYDELPRSTREALHRDVARALSDAGAPAVRVAEHVVRGSARIDPRAVEWLRRAASEVTDPAAAVELLERGLASMDPGASDRPAVRADLIGALHRAGRVGDAVQACLAALDAHPSDPIGPQIRLKLASLYQEQTRMHEALAEVRTVLSIPGLEPTQQRAAMRQEASVLLNVVGPAAAAERAREAVAGADGAGEAREGVYARITLCNALYWASRFDEAIACGQDAVTQASALAGDDDDEQLRGRAHSILGWAFLSAGRLDEAEVSFVAALERWEAARAVTSVVRGHEQIAQLAFHRGRWDEALLGWETADGLRERFDLQPWIQTSEFRAYIALHREDVRRARSLCRDAVSRVAAFPKWVARLAWIGALIASGSDVREGADRAAAAWRDPAEEGFVTIHVVEVLRLLRDGGRLDVAEEIVDRLEQRAGDDGGGIAGALRALLSGEAAPLVAAGGRLPYPSIGRVWMRAEAGAAVAREGRIDDARALFEGALDDLASLGATRDARAVRAMMRDAGIKPGARGPRRRARHGWEALTPTELEVVKLAVQGLTNPRIGERLFISKRTVATHLEHVFEKLAISSRQELRDRFEEHEAAGLPPGSAPPIPP